MPTPLEYALLAGHAYQSTRDKINWIPISDGWFEMPLSHVTTPSGFEAVSFQRGSEIVIAFAGTNPASLSDWLANGGLATGFGAQQLKDAALYYSLIKSDPKNSGAQITLTGHSPGGGLASLVGVFFNEKAVTFDQAPFSASASTSIRDMLLAYLTGTPGIADADLQPLRDFTGLDGRVGNVRGQYVQGEFLSQPSFSLFSRIGANPPLTHGTPDMSSGDLH